MIVLVSRMHAIRNNGRVKVGEIAWAIAFLVGIKKPSGLQMEE